MSSYLRDRTLVIVAAVVFAVIIYNKLQHLGQGVKAGHANVLTMLQKRADLANKLMDIAKEYGAHEKLAHITVSNNLVDTFNKTDEAITNVTALAMQYPDLKANGTYQKLMEQLHDIESAIQYKRETYNIAARGYNAYRLQIPQVFFAAALGFHEAPYFEPGNMQEIKEFHTDDGALLKDVISIATSRAVSLAKKGIEKGMEMTKQRYCTKCGDKNPLVAKFCKSCGSPLDQTTT